MAGILAPQLNETGAATGGVAPVVDTSVGDLIGNVSSILGGVGSAIGRRSTTTATQTDRDDAALRPAFDRIKKLTQKRDSGGITTTQFNVQSRALLKGTLASLPHLRTDITDGFSTITGQDLAPVNDDIGLTIAEGSISFLTNDPEGFSRLGEAMRYDDNGAIDQIATREATVALAMQIQAGRAKDDDMKRVVAQAKLTGDLTQQQQGLLIDPLLADITLIANDGASKLVENFFRSTDRSSLDALGVLNGLKVARTSYLQAFTSRAAAQQVQDEPRFQSGLKIAMAPFDSMIETMTALSQNEKLVNEILLAEDVRGSIEFFRGIGVPRNQDSQSTVALNMLADSQLDARVAMPNYSKQIKASATKTKTEGAVVSPEDGNLTPSAEATVSTMNTAERVDDINVNIEAFDTINSATDAQLVNPDNRNFFVEKFALATGIINTTGAPVTEASFEKIYPQGIVDQYNRVTSFDDDISNKFKESVKRNLSNILDRRTNVVNTRITNEFQSRFPSMKTVWDGKKFVVTISSAAPTGKERALIEALDTLGLPHTLEGIDQLGKIVRRDQIGVAESGLDQKLVREFDLSVFNSQSGDFANLKDDVRFLNKVAARTNLFPEEVSSSVLPKEVGTTVTVVTVNSMEELTSVDLGAEYRVKGSDQIFIRGQESLQNTPEETEDGE